jgi:hypothetical protein
MPDFRAGIKAGATNTQFRIKKMAAANPTLPGLNIAGTSFGFKGDDSGASLGLAGDVRAMDRVTPSMGGQGHAPQSSVAAGPLIAAA